MIAVWTAWAGLIKALSPLSLEDFVIIPTPFGVVREVSMLSLRGAPGTVGPILIMTFSKLAEGA